MDIAINVSGGVGKHLSLISVLPELKEKYDHIYIRTAYDDIFRCCPDVDYVYRVEEAQAFFFDNRDAKIVIDNMYTTDEFIKKQDCYANAWRRMLGLPLHKDCKAGSDTTIHLDVASAFPQLAQMLPAIEGDFIIVQFWGGQSPLQQVPADKDGKPDWSKVPYDYEHEPLKRHYPIEKAQQFVDLFRAAHPDVKIIQYSLPNEPALNGCERYLLPYLAYYMLAQSPSCKGTVSIDSSLQHLVAGVTKSVVLWAHSLPESFGYKYNHNIIQKCNRERILYFTELGPSDARVDYIKPENFLKEVNDYLFPVGENADDTGADQK